MIDVKVKSVWQGKVAVRDRYLEECKAARDGLRIKHNGDVMEIPYEKLKESIAGKSDKPFLDHFSSTAHFLYYFNWKPTHVTPRTDSLFA